MNNVIDAEWGPAQDWKHDPKAYSRRCRHIRRAKERIKTAYVQRLATGAVLLFAIALGMVIGVALAVR